MHGMKNISCMGLLWMWQWSSTDLQRHVIHSNSARHGLLWDMTFSHRCWGRLRLVDWWRVMDVSVERNAFILDWWPWRWRKINQSTGRSVPDDLNLHQHRCEIFTTTNCCPGDTHTHRVNGHEWSASCQASPMSTEQESGWESELAGALWSKEKSLPLPGIKPWWSAVIHNISTTLSQLSLIPASTKKL
jgi:hypothetical protein